MHGLKMTSYCSLFKVILATAERAIKANKINSFGTSWRIKMSIIPEA